MAVQGLLDPTRAAGHQRGAESDVSMALGAAFAATLVLIELVGLDTHLEVLALLAVIAGIALVFEGLAPRSRNRAARY